MIALVGPHVRVTVSPLAAMVVDAEFVVDGVAHRPLAAAPWLGEPGLESLPGHLRVLGGDFVGLPFGSSGAPEGLVSEWNGLVAPSAPEPPHGPAAEETWQVVDATADHVRLALDFPESSPVARAERVIAIRPDAAAIDFTLEIHARRVGDVSLGLHPILRLPARPGELVLDVPFERGFTYPGHIDPGLGPTAPWRTFDRLDAVPARAGAPTSARTVDLTRLPLATPVQDNVLLTGVSGPVVATFLDTRTRVRLDWDRTLLPSLMLWLSDGVIEEEPWRGRYRGLGVEPLAAAFDFADEVSTAPNPLSDANVVTSVALDPSAPVVVRHSLEVSS